MSRTLITNIAELTTNVGVPGGTGGTLAGAGVLLDGGRIAWIGSSSDAEKRFGGVVL